jgi:hypothetical protein
MSDDPMQAVLAALARLEAGQVQLRVDLMARLDRMQDTITAIRDDIAMNYGTAEHVRRANDNTRDELRALADTQMAMLRQIQRLRTDLDELKGRQA